MNRFSGKVIPAPSRITRHVEKTNDVDKFLGEYNYLVEWTDGKGICIAHATVYVDKHNNVTRGIAYLYPSENLLDMDAYLECAMLNVQARLK